MVASGLLVASSCSRTTPPKEPPSPASSPLAAEVEARVLSEGRVIAAEAFQSLGSRLRQAIEEGGVHSAIPYCSSVALPVTSAVAASNAVVIQRVTHRPRNPASRANPAELELIRGFESRQQSGQPLGAVAFGTPQGGARFYAPIVITNDLCLKCHGRIDQEVALDVVAVLRRQYPHDEATGFRLGDLRGLWRVDFPPERLATPAPSADPAPELRRGPL